jgi:3'-5' exoribonuclease
MEEKIYVKDLVADTYIDTTFLLKSIQVKQKRNGENFLALVLKDKTGEVQAVMWEGIEQVRDEASSGDYILLTGRVSIYQDRLQVTVQRMKKLDSEQVNEDDYLPATTKDVSTMWDDLIGVINTVGNLALRRLLLDIFDDEEISRKFQRAPAARGNHHTYIGGLLEHTLSVVHLCEMLGDHYDVLDRDLLIAGGLLHDLEKINELNYERNFEYTDEGRLVGHIVMGAIDLDRRMRQHEIPEKLRIRLLHMLVSHHGELEFGSPKVPMTPEALALHYIDMIDSRLEMYRMAVEQSAEMEGSFTAFHRGLERFFYKG